MQFVEFEKAMIQVVKCHFQVFFCFLTNRNCDFFKSKSDDSRGRIALKIHIRLLTSPKFDFGDVEKVMFQVVANHWELIFFLFTGRKYDLCEVEKAMFQGSHVTLNSFSASWSTQYATWVRSKKRCFKVSHDLNLFWTCG